MDEAPVNVDVDVVVLSHQRPELTIETLESILAQRGVVARVWVVDQNSGPATLERLGSFASAHREVTLVPLTHNAGVPGGRNVGAARGRAPCVVNIDNDAVFDSEHSLARIVSRFERDPSLGALALRILNFEAGTEESWSYPVALKRMAHEEFKAARFVGCGHALRRTAFDRAGGFDERLYFCEEELDLALKILDLGFEILYEPQVRVLHKVAPERRVRWDEDRFYYQTRNALYLNYKHFRARRRSVGLAAGYLAKAAYNRVLPQAARGIADALRMVRRDRAQGRFPPPLSEGTRDYVRRHETAWRGGLTTRVRNEVLVKMRGIE